MPMTRNTALNPKVRYKLSDGGAPAETIKQMEILVEDYKSSSIELTEKGYNGTVLDLELPVACMQCFLLTKMPQWSIL